MNTLSFNLAHATPIKTNTNKSELTAAKSGCFQLHRFYTVPVDREETFLTVSSLLAKLKHFSSYGLQLKIPHK